MTSSPIPATVTNRKTLLAPRALMQINTSAKACRAQAFLWAG
jgi:hypothetical protein